jgi:hypothetical protein
LNLPSRIDTQFLGRFGTLLLLTHHFTGFAPLKNEHILSSAMQHSHRIKQHFYGLNICENLYIIKITKSPASMKPHPSQRPTQPLQAVFPCGHAVSRPFSSRFSQRIPALL